MVSLCRHLESAWDTPGTLSQGNCLNSRSGYRFAFIISDRFKITAKYPIPITVGESLLSVMHTNGPSHRHTIYLRQPQRDRREGERVNVEDWGGGGGGGGNARVGLWGFVFGGGGWCVGWGGVVGGVEGGGGDRRSVISRGSAVGGEGGDIRGC